MLEATPNVEPSDRFLTHPRVQASIPRTKPKPSGRTPHSSGQPLLGWQTLESKKKHTTLVTNVVCDIYHFLWIKRLCFAKQTATIELQVLKLN